MQKKLFDLIRNANCTDCELHKSAQSVCLIGDGKWPADIMFIGEAPGFREDNIRKPFAGRAGKLLDGILEACNLQRYKSNIFISNAVKCRPPENAKPSAFEIEQCGPYLEKELSYVKPKVIICLGVTASKAVLGKGAPNVKNGRGKTFNRNGAKVIVTYHPAAALRRQPHLIEYIITDVKRAIKLTNGGSIKKAKHTYYRINSSNLKEMVKRLSHRKLISFDVETTGLDMYDPSKSLLSISFSPEKEEAFFLPIQHNSSDISLDRTQWAVDYILNSAGKIIGHNVKFDLRWLNVVLRFFPRVPIRDTMLMFHLLDEIYPDKTLKHLVRIFTPLGPDLDRWEDKAGDKKNFSVDMDIRKLILYNCGDSDGTRRLYSRFLPRIKEEGLLDLMKFQGDATEMFLNIELNGFTIDNKRRKVLRKEYRRNILKIEGELRKPFRPDLNLNSPRQITPILYDEMALPVLERTDKGAPSAAEGVLLKLLETRINKKARLWIEGLLEHRTLNKIYSTYLEGIDVKQDGRVHANYRQTGTVTGRLSCADPNLQQIPREGPVKSIFISRFRDGRILQGDHNQIELRGLAHKTQDPRLLKAFREKFDIHRWAASLVFKKNMEDIDERERKKAKTVNFGIAYCIGPEGLAVKGNMSLEEAKKVMKAWKIEFAEVPKWIRGVQREAFRTKVSITEFGRRRRFTVVDFDSPEGRESLRQAVNFPIQSIASDITVFGMVKVYKWLKKRGLKSVLIGNVHDASLTDCPPNEYMKVARMTKKLMENPGLPFKFKCPLALEVKAGRSWKDMKVLEI